MADDLVAQYDSFRKNISYHAKDGLDSTVALKDINVSNFINEAYGKLTSAANPSGYTGTEFLFNGQQFDPNSALYYLRARYYDPNDGMFLTQYPWAGSNRDPVSLHRYLYAANDPVDRVDPSGWMDSTETRFAIGISGTLDAISAVGAVVARRMLVNALYVVISGSATEFLGNGVYNRLIT